jgi:hypothetical protein
MARERLTSVPPTASLSSDTTKGNIDWMQKTTRGESKKEKLIL